MIHNYCWNLEIARSLSLGEGCTLHRSEAIKRQSLRSNWRQFFCADKRLPANIKSTLTGLRDDHLALGKGTIRFTELIKRIRTTGYDDTLTLEIFENDRQTLVQSKNLVKSLLNK